MSSSPTVTIVIPCFNSLWILPSLIDSLKPLLRNDVEVVFVDDGSTDNTASALRELMPEATLISQKNRGVAAARNSGVEVAKAEFIQFLDADDTIEGGKFEAQIEMAKRQNLDVVYSDWRMVIIDPEGVECEPWHIGEAPVEMISALLGSWWAPPHAYLVRRLAYCDIGGSDENLVNAQDFDLWVRLAIAGKRFGYVAGNFANYYRYKQRESLARGPRPQYWGDYEKAVRKAVSLLEAGGALTPQRRGAAANRLLLIARNVFLIDQTWFESLVDLIYTLDPFFKPAGSRTYRLAANLLGLRKAETIAVWSRRWRSKHQFNLTV
jgi:glycosyltransferase involved in cell wall biosynthesis